MKCRICGNYFDGEGDICEECLSEESGGRETKSSKTEELFKFKRKHLIRFELLRYYYVYFVFILSGILTGKSWVMILCILGMLIVTGYLLFRSKRIARATTCRIFDDRIELKGKMGLFIDINRTINFKDFGDIVGQQSFLQRFFDLGDVLIYTTKPNLLTTGIEVRNVANFKETFEQIKEIIDEKTNKEV